jgi:G:T-mismatch repair DNA endonuclease (very short patch repair protein)
VSRDARNLRALKDSGWRVLIVWECWTRDTAELSSQVKLFMHAIRR